MKVLKLLVFLVVLAAIGLGIWYVYFPEKELPFIPRPYPKTLTALQGEAGVEAHPLGFTAVRADHRTDLFLMQGYQHGRDHGEKLDLLRRLFQGERAPGLPADLKELAELFYYLDLTRVAQACKAVYTPELRVFLKSYADGLTAGRKDPETQAAWTVDDVLLLQRGYAFLMGRNMIKEWAFHRLANRFGAERLARCADYPVGNFGALTEGLQLGASLDGLMGRPLMETVRLYRPGAPLACEVRTHPFLAFLFEPTLLELTGTFEVKGLALVGQPFLYAGRNKHLAWQRRPMAADDEQFTAVSDTVTGYEQGPYREDPKAPNVTTYPKAPMYGPAGMRMTALVKGAPGMEIFYYWDGLRPSADLTALYYLLETQTVDAALSAYQYHQVPAGELTLATRGARVVNMAAYPSDPYRTRDMSSLFSRAFTRIGRPIPGLAGIHAHADAYWDADQVGTPGASQLDEELVALVRFYLQGPIGPADMPLDTQEQLLALLAQKDDPRRDLFLSNLWQLWSDLMAEEYVDEASRPALRALPTETARLVLDVYGRNARDADVSLADLDGRTRTVAGLLQAAWHRHLENETPTYLFPDKRGRLQPKRLDTAVHASDAANGWCYVQAGNRIKQVTTYTVILDADLTYWRYQFAKSGDLGPPRRINNPRATAAMHRIKPLL